MCIWIEGAEPRVFFSEMGTISTFLLHGKYFVMWNIAEVKGQEVVFTKEDASALVKKMKVEALRITKHSGC